MPVHLTHELSNALGPFHPKGSGGSSGKANAPRPEKQGETMGDIRKRLGRITGSNMMPVPYRNEGGASASAGAKSKYKQGFMSLRPKAVDSPESRYMKLIANRLRNRV